MATINLECFLCKAALQSLGPKSESNSNNSLSVRQEHSRTLIRLFTFLHQHCQQEHEPKFEPTSTSIGSKTISNPELLQELGLESVDLCMKCTYIVRNLVKTFKVYDTTGHKLEQLKNEVVAKIRDVQCNTCDDDTNSRLRKQIIDGFIESPTRSKLPGRQPNPVVKLRRIEDFPLSRQIGKTMSTAININIKEEPVDIGISPDEVNDLHLGIVPPSQSLDEYETHSAFVGSDYSDIEPNSDPEYEPDPPRPKRRRNEARRARTKMNTTKSKSKVQTQIRKGRAKTASTPSTLPNEAGPSHSSACKESQRRPDPKKRFQRLQHYPCDFDNCNQQFERLPALDEHARLAHAESERTWACGEPKCSMAFFKECSLTHHIHFVHSTDYKYPCPKCLEGFDNYDEYVRHQKQKHIGATIIGVLGKPIRASRRLPEDKFLRPRRIPKLVFPCDYQNREFQGREEWETQAHLGTAHSTTPRPFTCPDPDCNARFIREERFGRHKHWAHSNFRYPCQDCDFGCDLVKTMETHHLRVHGRGNRCPYEDCDYIGITDNLKMHLASSVHADRAPDHGQRKHMCQHCGAAFMSTQVLKYHITSRHPELVQDPDELKRFHCQHCNRILGDPFSLRSHLRHVHNEGGDRGNFHCDKCGKAFFTPYTLRKHMSSHLDPEEFEYECEVCHAKFRHRNILAQHMRRHTGDYKDICNECGKKFLNRHALKRHMKIHAGILKYVCPQCNKGFPRRDYLTTHLKSHMSKEEREARKKQKPVVVAPLQKIYHDLWRKRSTVASVTAYPLSTAADSVAPYPMHYNFQRERKNISRVLTPEEMEGTQVATKPAPADGK